MENSKKFCAQCGTELSADVLFCPACGTKCETAAPVEQIPVNNTPASAPQKKSKKKLIVIIAAAVVALLVVVGLVSCIGGSPDYEGTWTAVEYSLDGVTYAAEEIPSMHATMEYYEDGTFGFSVNGKYWYGNWEAGDDYITLYEKDGTYANTVYYDKNKKTLTWTLDNVSMTCERQ